MSENRHAGPILIVEDDRNIAALVDRYLAREGFLTIQAHDGNTALSLAKRQPPLMVILDVMLPGLDGWEVCRALRRESDVPILMLTAREAEMDRVVGLSIGADDYVVKPFSPRELTARVGAVLRRTQSSASSGDEDSFVAGPFVVDRASWTIRYRSVELDLTRHEFEILRILVSSPERVYSRENLLQMVWEAPDHRLSRTVDAHIKNLRAKLRAIEPGDDPIRTRRGVGYFASWPK